MIDIKYKIYIFASIIITAFSFIGVYVSGIAIHEMIHYNDLKDTVIVDNICLVNIPFNTDDTHFLGYVTYDHPVNDSIEVNGILEHSELRATSGAVILNIIFVIAFFIVLIKD